VIHTVGPIYFDYSKQEAEQLLAQCYKSILLLCEQYKLKTVSLCSISTGFYGFPIEDETRVKIETVRQYLTEHGNSTCIEKIIFNTFFKENAQVVDALMPMYFP